MSKCNRVKTFVFFVIILSLEILFTLKYAWSWGVLLIVITVLLIALLIRKRRHKKTSLLSGCIGITFFVVLLGLVRPFQALNLEDTEYFYQLQYESDQDDRMMLKTIFFKAVQQKVSVRDSIRLQHIKIKDSLGLIIRPMDQYYAAMIYHHGKNIENIERALELATAAVEGGVSQAEFLKRASYDRIQIRKGKKQKYGTQF